VFSWLRDPSGNWFELVQRDAPGWSLAEVDLAADCWDEIIEWRTAGTPA
jgi:hypothetical protein